MKMHLIVSQDCVQVRMRFEDEGKTGEAFRTVKPGEKFFNLSYEELRQHGDGVLDTAELKPQQGKSE